MARFRIDSTKKGPPPAFVVSVLDGELSEGMSFRLYETHHLVVFRILSITVDDGYTTLAVNKYIPWDGEWEGSVVATEDQSQD